MNDISEYFKNALNHHKKVDKNYQKKRLEDRMGNFNNLRKESRNDLLFGKRNLAKNMTPINTPESSKIGKHTAEKNKENKSNNRLEMLYKWKAEKEKKQREEKLKSKPLFKVFHVPVVIGLPNLEMVNKQIKGKTIRPFCSKSQFAPPNHKFRAPKNIQPININKIETRSESNPKLRTFSWENSDTSNSLQVCEVTKAVETPEISKSKLVDFNDIKQNEKSRIITGSKKGRPQNKSKKRSEIEHNLKTTETNKISEHNTKEKNTIITRSKKVKTVVPICNFKKSSEIEHRTKKTLISKRENVMKKSKEVFNINHNISMKTPKKTSTKSENKVSSSEIRKQKDLLKNTLRNNRKVSTNYVETPTKSVKTSKKNIGWDIVKIESDDEIVAKGISKMPEKVGKTYNKTPRRCHKSKMLDDSKLEEIDKLIGTKVPPFFTSKTTRRSEKSSNSFQSVSVSDLDGGSPTKSMSPDYPIESINFNTPSKSSSQEMIPVYISPFVTVSRGKSSARKEYEIRRSVNNKITGTPDLAKNITNFISPKAGADYFVVKLNNEILRIEKLCHQWNRYTEDSTIPEEASDIINVALGQSKLLLSSKFQQFRGLIEQCKTFDNLEKPITCDDLHGFWDMIYIQIQDLDKRFDHLEVLKKNNWQEILPENKPVIKIGKGRTKKSLATSKLKSIINAARMNKKLESDLSRTETNELKMFTGGYLSLTSPVREKVGPITRNSSARKSLRNSFLTNQVKTRYSSSPGLTMMKVSQVLKFNTGETPGKSILKTDITKSSSKPISKSVLFKDYVENVDAYNSPKEIKQNKIKKENNLNNSNLIMFSPGTPKRRSERLIKKSVK